MSGPVILGIPPALVLYAAALFLVLFDRRYRATGGWFTILAAVLVLGATAYSLLHGAPTAEAAIVLLTFALLGLEART